MGVCLQGGRDRPPRLCHDCACTCITREPPRPHAADGAWPAPRRRVCQGFAKGVGRQTQGLPGVCLPRAADASPAAGLHSTAAADAAGRGGRRSGSQSRRRRRDPVAAPAAAGW